MKNVLKILKSKFRRHDGVTLNLPEGSLFYGKTRKDVKQELQEMGFKVKTGTGKICVSHENEKQLAISDISPVKRIVLCGYGGTTGELMKKIAEHANSLPSIKTK